MNRRFLFLFGLAALIGAACAACGANQPAPGGEQDARLELVVTTTFLGDVVQQVAGEVPLITTLLEPGQNPHSYQPTPQDMVKIYRAGAIFANGLDLEEFLDDLLAGSGTQAALIVVSEDIQPLGVPDLEVPGEAEQEDREQHGHQVGYDPHVWFDPHNVILWTDRIASALSALDPDRAPTYQANADLYREKLLNLDSWIREEVSRIPEENRKLVTDHTSLGYFAEQYGFIQVGAVIPALTTEAETSGQELAGLVDTIREYQVKAIFIGIDFDPTLAQQVAVETGVDLVPLYFGSLSEGEPAGSYLDFMRYDVTAIVNALK